MFRIEIIPYNLQFKRPAGTSRGVYTNHRVWYVVFRDTKDESHYGIGECAPLHDLSCDYTRDYAETLAALCKMTEEKQQVDPELIRNYPSILFGLETAMQHYQRRSWQLWDTPFSKGEQGITINGLVWMGDHAAMMEQIQSLLSRGFHCIKLKIGAIDFDRELDLLRFIRSRYTSQEVILRVDANGNFNFNNVIAKLHQLAELGIHSIEQPIPAGQWQKMAGLCASTPLPIALDEELIGVNDPAEKRKLLETIHPQYIILKPSLHGGIAGCTGWIELAGEMNIGWWITSALESNIGLNSIAQWCATFNNPLPQGLGTGTLYTNNIPVPLEIRGERLWFTEETGTGGLRDRETGRLGDWGSGGPGRKIDIEGKMYTPADFTGESETDFAGKSPFHRQLYLFLREWFSDSATFCLHTSGSTGTPKEIIVRKEQMLQSAKGTCDFFHLKKGDKALLCLPLEYIAGKMMVVRALYAGLDIHPVEPDGHPLIRTDIPFDFAAMVPLQVYNSLQAEKEKQRLSQIKHLIIGGGAIDETLDAALREFPNSIYSTYGMTETLSHIALRSISGTGVSSYYTPFPTVEVALSEDNRLIINAPLIADQPLLTNDIAELRTDGSFRIIGRIDNVINSGGIKIQIEEVEHVLHPFITGNFAITSIPHPKLGEAIVLLIEQPDDPVYVEKTIRQLLPRHQQPLLIYVVEAIPQTGNGKIDRSAVKQLAKKINLSSPTTGYMH
ncbi:MAG: O-succinylbenzoate synthase [Bacteroidia bacterium 44-10]|nr:MAG: O-succinylbenzoate synthase [Bacteroidia bacterium 44-10]